MTTFRYETGGAPPINMTKQAQGIVGYEPPCDGVLVQIVVEKGSDGVRRWRPVVSLMVKDEAMKAHIELLAADLARVLRANHWYSDAPLLDEGD
jgi:hypothetical protein